MTYPFQGICDDESFRFELCRFVDVLPLTTSADPEVRARRGHTRSRWFHHVDKVHMDVSGVFCLYMSFNHVTGARRGNECDAAVGQMRHSCTAVGKAFDLKAHEFSIQGWSIQDESALA